MASQCGKCQAEILNSDFIECNGSCRVQYHAKCVALNRTTLNAITSNANVYWYCHICNESRNDPSSTNIKDDMNQMMKSLTECLMNGFSMMTERVVQSVSARPPVPVNFQSVDNLKKRRREDDDHDDASQSASRNKKFVSGTNDKHSLLAVAAVHDQIDRPELSIAKENRKSVVVWNIDKSISADHIVDYLANEVKTDKCHIRVTPLAPSGKNLSELTYMQYRVSVPATIYPNVMSGDTWPKGVRVRDFLYTKRKDIATLDNFLLKKASQTPPSIANSPIKPSSPPTVAGPSSTNSMETDQIDVSSICPNV